MADYFGKIVGPPKTANHGYLLWDNCLFVGPLMSIHVCNPYADCYGEPLSVIEARILCSEMKVLTYEQIQEYLYQGQILPSSNQGKPERPSRRRRKVLFDKERGT